MLVKNTFIIEQAIEFKNTEQKKRAIREINRIVVNQPKNKSDSFCTELIYDRDNNLTSSVLKNGK